MIYFVIPSSSGLVGVNTTVNLDVNSSLSADIKTLAQGSGDYNIQQSAVDGINSNNEKYSFGIVNLPMATLEIIDAYFRQLKATSVVVITFPEGAKNFLINSWSPTLSNSLYGSIQVEAEIAH